MGEHVLKGREGAVLVLTLNRADKKNALTGAMYDALSAGLAEANADEEIGATLILGQPGIFCAGNDIMDFMAFAMKGGVGEPIINFLKALVANRKPLVAGVDGGAVGIGTTMLLHCDYVVASERAVFATPFVDLALVPEAGSSLILPELMGHRVAFEMLVMGKRFDAARARETGLVNAVVSPDALEQEARAAAAAIAAKPREAVAIARALMKGDPAILLARIDEEARTFAERLRSAEARKAFEAFMSRPKA
ncbi:MAG: crotonase/enoyl-CoA hydratase family protein [Proteobacteria bacterium]|nr:crotonase/enoyl-CoA hydratase family protein [Pseudomonadota bacterium]